MPNPTKAPHPPALQPAVFYLPPPSADWARWAVIACDQYTSQPEKWEATEQLIGDAPSTLRLILPEIYLNRPDTENRIRDIRSAMTRYLEEGILQPTEAGYILVDRSTPFSQSRKGLIAAVDLEEYSFQEGTEALVRPTEKTILERIPPRIRIRQEAPLELPHIMILINDPQQTVLEPLFRRQEESAPLYDFELLEGQGRVSGRFLPADPGNRALTAPLTQLIEDHFLYAVGDGNHSLATAKQFWEEVKGNLPPGEQGNHPARFALAEIVNIRGEGVPFEPIHRLLTGIDGSKLAAYLLERASGTPIQTLPSGTDKKEIMKAIAELDSSMDTDTLARTAVLISPEKTQFMQFPLKKGEILVEKLQPLLDSFLHGTETSSIDFIHGSRELTDLALASENRAGLFLPPIDKDSFFSSVAGKGPLPRKTFSMGEAEEKRFYIEARKIIP